MQLEVFNANMVVPIDGRIGFGIPPTGTSNQSTGPQVLATDGDPNGMIAAPAGSLALDFDTPTLWRNDDGVEVWIDIGDGGGGGGEDLAATLILGNITGGTSVEISAGDVVKGVDAAGGSGLQGSPVTLRGGAGDGVGKQGVVLLLVGTNGSIQTDSGGDARGARAIDLQATRNRADAVASGIGAFIGGGYNCEASGDFSAAFNYSYATATYAFSIGFGEASGYVSFASGYGYASMDYCFAHGLTGAGGRASGLGAVCFSSGPEGATGDFSFCQGTDTSSPGNNSSAWGIDSYSHGIASWAWGNDSSTRSTAPHSMAGGGNSRTDVPGQLAISSGVAGGQGVSQWSIYHLEARTTDATPTVMQANTGGVPANLIVVNGRAYGFRVMVTAFDYSNEVASTWEVTGLIRRKVVGVGTVLVGSTVTLVEQDAGAAAWGVAVAAGVDDLKFTVTGALGVTIEWSNSAWSAEAGP